jgi:hypothetical protein
VDQVLARALFRDLAHDRLRACLQPLTVREFAAGETVAEPSRRRPALHLVLTGRLRVFEVSGSGRRVVLDYVEPGGVDGLLTMAGLRGHFTEAVLPSGVVTMTPPVFDGMIAAEPRLAVNPLWIMSRRLRRREDQVNPAGAAGPCPPPRRAVARPLGQGGRRGTGGLEPAALPRSAGGPARPQAGDRDAAPGAPPPDGRLRVEDRRFRLDVHLLEAIRDGSARHRRRP